MPEIITMVATLVEGKIIYQSLQEIRYKRDVVIIKDKIRLPEPIIDLNNKSFKKLK